MDDSRLRSEFEKLRSLDLLAVARNQAAHARMLAIEMLVLRGAPEAMHADIAHESYNFVLSNPLILKKCNPADLMGAKIPGVVDVVDSEIKARQSLERTVSKNHATQSDRTASLESVVSKNNEAQSQRSASLETTVARNHETQSKSLSVVVADLESKLAGLKTEAEKEWTAAKDRLARLERSVWKKLTDWIKSFRKR